MTIFEIQDFRCSRLLPLVLKIIKVYLDPLVEVEQNWLVPLIDPISRNYKIVTEPFIDKICPYTFQLKASTFTAQIARERCI